MISSCPLRPLPIALSIALLSLGSAHGQTQSLERVIIVTAQKVPQLASKVPGSLTVATGDDLRAAGAQDATALTDIAPNVQITPGSSGATSISIRGIASSNNTEVGDPAAAFHIDGAYLGRPQQAGAAFYDLERVEILRGPQGTLYGRNATAGVVNLITNKPGKQLAGDVSLLAGNYAARGLDGFINVPVNEMFALRAAVHAFKREGYLVTTSPEKGFDLNRDDADNLSARVHALLSVNPDTSLLVTLEAAKDRGAGPGMVALSTFRNNSGSAQRTELRNLDQGSRDDESNAATAEFKTTLGFADLTYLGSHRTFRRDDRSAFLMVTTEKHHDYRQNSHELRLNSHADAGNRLSWLAGLYAYDERGHVDETYGVTVFAPLPGLRFLQSPVNSTSLAAFGQGSYALSKDWRISAGLRNTHDEKDRLGRVTDASGRLMLPALVNKASVSYRKTTWRLGTEYDLTPDVLVYASAATGYKAGGYYDGNKELGDNSYRPELLDALEAGVKARFLNGSLRVNAAVFDYRYRDLQISYVALNPATQQVGTITTNAAGARNRGLELDARWACWEGGAFSAALALLDARYSSFVLPAVPRVRPVAIDFSGNRLDQAPEITLTLGYHHYWSLASGAGLSIGLSSRYSAASVLSSFSAAAPEQYRQAGHTRSNLTAAYYAPSDSWYVQAYLRNIENRSVVVGYASGGPFGQNVALSDPRNFGVRAGMRF